MQILGGNFQRKKLVTPSDGNTRPSTGLLREAVFNICQTSIQDAHFLDLYAGSGAIGLEALSRGASKAILVENHPQAIQCIKKNIANLEVEKSARIFTNDVFHVLKHLQQQKEKFTIIYADPPFSKDPHSREAKMLVEMIDQYDLLASEGIFFFETPWKHPPDIELKSLSVKASRKYGRAVLHQYQRKDKVTENEDDLSDHSDSLKDCQRF